MNREPMETIEQSVTMVRKKEAMERGKRDTVNQSRSTIERGVIKNVQKRENKSIPKQFERSYRERIAINFRPVVRSNNLLLVIHGTLHCPATHSQRSVRSIEIPVLCPRRFGASQGVPSITAGSSVA